MAKVRCNQIQLTQAHIGKTIYRELIFFGHGLREQHYSSVGTLISFNHRGKIYVRRDDYKAGNEELKATEYYIETEEAKSAGNNTA